MVFGVVKMSQAVDELGDNEQRTPSQKSSKKTKKLLDLMDSTLAQLESPQTPQRN